MVCISQCVYVNLWIFLRFFRIIFLASRFVFLLSRLSTFGYNPLFRLFFSFWIAFSSFTISWHHIFWIGNNTGFRIRFIFFLLLSRSSFDSRQTRKKWYKKCICAVHRTHHIPFKYSSNIIFHYFCTNCFVFNVCVLQHKNSYSFSFIGVVQKYSMCECMCLDTFSSFFVPFRHNSNEIKEEKRKREPFLH